MAALRASLGEPGTKKTHKATKPAAKSAHAKKRAHRPAAARPQSARARHGAHRAAS
jgi:hypothetical protein